MNNSFYLILFYLVLSFSCMKSFDETKKNIDEKGIFILIDANDFQHIVGKFIPFQFAVFGKKDTRVHIIKSNLTLLYFNERVEELNFLFEYSNLRPFKGSNGYLTQNKDKMGKGNPYWYRDMIVKISLPEEINFAGNEVLLLKLKHGQNLYNDPIILDMFISFLTFGISYIMGGTPTKLERIDFNSEIIRLDFKKSSKKSKEFKVETINNKTLSFTCDKELGVSNFLDVTNVDNNPFAKVYVYEKTGNTCIGEVIYPTEARVFVGDKLIRN